MANHELGLHHYILSTSVGNKGIIYIFIFWYNVCHTGIQNCLHYYLWLVGLHVEDVLFSNLGFGLYSILGPLVLGFVSILLTFGPHTHTHLLS